MFSFERENIEEMAYLVTFLKTTYLVSHENVRQFESVLKRYVHLFVFRQALEQ